MRTLIPVLFLLGACTEQSDDDTAATVTAESDVDTMARVGAVSSEGIGDISAEITLVEGSMDGVGDCVWLYEVSGTPTSGTITWELESTPCGGAYTGDNGSGTYTLTDGSLSGTYSGSAGAWSVSMSGYRDATLMLDTERAGEREWDSSWTLESFEATTDGDSLGAWAMLLDYEGFRGRTWSLDVAGDGDNNLTGTLSNDTRSCTVTGSPEAVSFACQ